MSFNSTSRPTPVPWLALLAVAPALGGCSDDAVAGSMTIEVASTDPSCAAETEDPPPNFACALISVCERLPGEATCTQRPVVPCARDEEGETQCASTDVSEVGTGPLGNSALVSVNASNDFSFLVQLDEGEVEDPGLDRRYLEITTELYDEAGVPRYRGIRTGVRADRFFSDPLAMRVYPFARSACAGPNGAGEIERRLRDRAFHAATRLPNGDVLIYGGVRSEAPIDNLGPMSVGSPPQPVIEIYRAQEDRIEVLDGMFSRVLFGSVLLTQDPDAEQYQIYVSGGFRAVGSLLRWDVNQNLPQNFYGTPVLVGEEAAPEGDVILTYDRTTGSVDVQAVDDMETFGAVVADAEPGMTYFPVTGGVTDAALRDPAAPLMRPGTWTFARTNRWISRDSSGEDTMAVRSTSNADRFGHSVTLLPDLGQAFVWGGNLATTDGVSLETSAGQIFRQGGMASDASSVGSGAPPPTAFHTVTPLVMSEVLLIGGMKTNCLGTEAPCGQNGITVFPADNPVVRLTVGATGVSNVFVYSAQPFDNSIFHAATRIDRDSIMMTGGASCTVSGTIGCAARTLFTESDRIYTVSRDRGAFNDPDDDLPETLLAGRFGHQVTRLDTCPPNATDCSDPRYLVTGGMRRATDNTIEAIRIAEVILKQRTGSRGVLSFGPGCTLSAGDAGVIDSGTPDTSTPDTSTPDSGAPDGGTGMDGAAPDGG